MCLYGFVALSPSHLLTSISSLFEIPNVINSVVVKNILRITKMLCCERLVYDDLVVKDLFSLDMRDKNKKDDLAHQGVG